MPSGAQPFGRAIRSGKGRAALTGAAIAVPAMTRARTALRRRFIEEILLGLGLGSRWVEAARSRKERHRPVPTNGTTQARRAVFRASVAHRTIAAPAAVTAAETANMPGIVSAAAS